MINLSYVDQLPMWVNALLWLAFIAFGLFVYFDEKRNK